MKGKSNKKEFLAFSKNKKGIVGITLSSILMVTIIIGAVFGVLLLKEKFQTEKEVQLSIRRKAEAQEGLSKAQKEEIVTGIKCQLSDSVVMMAKNKYTQAASGNHDFELWMKGADTSDPNQVAVTTATTSSGKATDTSGLWESCFDDSDYDLYTEGGSTYYDGLVDDWYLVYQENTADSLMHFIEDGQDRIWHAVLPIGTISDFDTAASCNGATCGTADTAELDDSGTDEITYNETAGDGTFYVEYDIGNAVSQTSLKDVVMCFQDANTGSDALEGNEVSSLSIQFISGTDIRSPNSPMRGDIVQIWKESAGTGSYVCRPFATLVDGAVTGRYRFTFTVSATNWGADEQIKMIFDDNGAYGAFEYPSGDAKATASGVTFKDRV